MKTIGIMSRIEVLNNKDILYIPLDMYRKVKNNFNIMIIPFDKKDKLDKVIDLIKLCDGIILPGGDDIYKIEIDIVKYLYENDIPTLGICLGMQTISVAFGSKFIQDRVKNHKSNNKYVHKVIIDENSLLYKILEKKEITVNSRHKDTITKPKLFIGAKAEDNIIEEIEDPLKKCFIGVQWHPENLSDNNSKKLFNYFLNKL